jgi:hypothetical protein
VLNWAIELRRSEASAESCCAASADCLEPAAYCRETSDTWLIAATTWSDALRCCWVAMEISRAAAVVSSTIPEMRDSEATAPRASSTPTACCT